MTSYAFDVHFLWSNDLTTTLDSEQKRSNHQQAADCERPEVPRENVNKSTK